MRQDPFKNFYLRKHIDKERVQMLVEYVENYGREAVEIERHRGEVILCVFDSADAELVQSQFHDLIDAKVDCS